MSKAYFSFRAEAPFDVYRFHEECRVAGISMTSVITPMVRRYPDRKVEVLADTKVEALRSCMNNIEDGHVMMETLRECRLADNSLERDRDVY